MARRFCSFIRIEPVIVQPAAPAENDPDLVPTPRAVPAVDDEADAALLPGPASNRQSPRLRARAKLTARPALMSKLTEADRELLRHGLESNSAYVSIPEMVVLAAKAATAQHGRGAGALPQSLAQAQRIADWPNWRAAIEKEIGPSVGRS